MRVRKVRVRSESANLQTLTKLKDLDLPIPYFLERFATPMPSITLLPDGDLIP